MTACSLTCFLSEHMVPDYVIEHKDKYQNEDKFAGHASTSCLWGSDSPLTFRKETKFKKMAVSHHAPNMATPILLRANIVWNIFSLTVVNQGGGQHV